MHDVAKRSGSDLLSYVGVAAGALALGALAVGAIAVGRLAIGRMAVRRVRFRAVQIDDLVVRRLYVLEEPRETMTAPDEHPSGASPEGNGEARTRTRRRRRTMPS